MCNYAVALTFRIVKLSMKNLKLLYLYGSIQPLMYIEKSVITFKYRIM